MRYRQASRVAGTDPPATAGPATARAFADLQDADQPTQTARRTRVRSLQPDDDTRTAGLESLRAGITSVSDPGPSGERSAFAMSDLPAPVEETRQMDVLPTFLFAIWLTKPLWMWLGFLAIVILLLALDLGVLHRENREIGVRESIVLSAGYIALGLGFGAWVWWQLGAQSGMEYLTGFAVEKALAMDNVFVIAMIFAFFAVPRRYQHRVLFWGILGVIVLRAIMIGLGATIVAQFSWVLYVFAVILVATGIKMIVFAESEYNVGSNPVLSFVRRRFAVTDAHHGEKFWVRLPHPRTGRPTWHMTPLFLALVLIEIADVIFAVDSVPAIFAITTDPFVVYTSNVFAILGLRALYFALAAMVARFRYLKYALAMVLIFIGSKIFLADLMGLEKFPPSIALGVTFSILAAGVGYSLWRTRAPG
jgi:tellurite resistance protein TerC